MKYWSKLTVVEKESLMNVAKNYVQLKEGEDAGDARKNLIRAERESYLNGEGKSLSWQQVKEMAINKEKRNAL